MHKQKFHKEIPCDFIHFARDFFISYSQLPPIFHSADKARAVHPYLLAHGSLFYNADTLYIDKISFPAGVAADSAYETDDAPTFPENADFLVSVFLERIRKNAPVKRIMPAKRIIQLHVTAANPSTSTASTANVNPRSSRPFLSFTNALNFSFNRFK